MGENPHQRAWAGAREDLHCPGFRHEGGDAAVGQLAVHLGAPLVERQAIATGGNVLTDGHRCALCTVAQVLEDAPRTASPPTRTRCC